MAPILRALPLVALLAVLPAKAVRLDPNGLGQALIFPYYTARSTLDGPWNTLFSVVNNDSRAKVLKVRFREGVLGRLVWEANVYLGPNDMWTGAVVPGQDGAAHLVSADASCIDPPHAGTDAGAFSNASFARDSNAAGTGVDRTLEGYAEVIEMGTLIGATADAVTVDTGQAFSRHDCSAVTGTRKDRQIAVALADLTSTPFYSEVGAPGTDFDSPQVTPVSVVLVPPSSAVNFGDSPAGLLLRSTWAKGVDAVSAVLMAASIRSEYVLETATFSQTDWVATLPTQRFYADGTSLAPPFETPTNVPNSTCQPYTATSYDREQAAAEPYFNFDGLPDPAVCASATVLPLRNGRVNAPFTPASPSLLLRSLNIPFGAVPVSSKSQDGFAVVDLASGPGLTSLSDSTAIDLATGTVIAGPHVFKGLPLTGFAAWNFNNGLLDCGGQSCRGSFGVAYPLQMIRTVVRPNP